MTQTLLKNDAGQETVSQEEIQRKIIEALGLKLWLYYGEGTVPLEQEGITHTVTIKRGHTAVTKAGQTLELTDQETDSLGQYIYQQLMAEHSQGKTIVPSPGQAETTQELLAQKEEELAQKDRIIQQQARTIEWHIRYEEEMHEIITNHNMTYSDRSFLATILKNHPEEMLSLKPFQPNISRIRQESGLSPDSATKFLAAMHEAGGIRYSNKPQNEEGDWSSISTIIPLPNHTQVNTRAAALRVKQRTETTKRRLARKLVTVPCENCGSDNPADAYSAIVPYCKNCNHASISQQEMIPAKNVRIIEEEIIPPTGETASHEFSEVTEQDDQEYLEENTKAHEFSEVPTNDPDNQDSDLPTNSQIQESLPPSHEFSEGDRVSTPAGIGIVSFIGEFRGHKRYRIKFGIKQQDGTYYTAFDPDELEPIIQSSLLEEREE